MNDNNPSDLYKFTGHERDAETGLNYMLARNGACPERSRRDPEIGLFLSVDPLADKFPGWSPYNYTLNNPVMMTDPDGKAAWPVTTETIAIGNAIKKIESFFSNLLSNGKTGLSSLLAKAGPVADAIGTGSDLVETTAKASSTNESNDAIGKTAKGIGIVATGVEIL